MPEIIVKHLQNKSIPVRPGSGSILKNILESYTDWMHACGGKGRCTTCQMEVSEGGELLSPISSFEAKMADSGRLPNGSRLACQCSLEQEGRLVISAPERYRFPH